jgi:hypothetical protein
MLLNSSRSSMTLLYVTVNKLAFPTSNQPPLWLSEVELRAYAGAVPVR